MARNIEYTASNWSGGAVGVGQIPRGHSDDAISDDYPNNPLQGISFTGHKALAAASANGTPFNWNFADAAEELAAGYRGTGNTSAQPVGGGWEQRRTLQLSNGQVIWDVAGNVWEWVNFNETSGPGGPTTLDSFTEDGITNSLTTFNSRLVPAQPNLGYQTRELNNTEWHSPNNSSALDPLWFLPKGYFAGTSPYYGSLSNYGLGRITTIYNPNNSYAVLRGNAWNSNSNAGVFTASLDGTPTGSFGNVGFRCVVVPSP
jgi:formylglycine-generating enzyme required for sulfatase activity